MASVAVASSVVQLRLPKPASATRCANKSPDPVSSQSGGSAPTSHQELPDLVQGMADRIGANQLGGAPPTPSAFRGRGPGINLNFIKRMLPEGETRSRAKDMQRTGWVIDPRGKKWMARWDATMVVCMLFTALVTPVEVAFLSEGAHINTLWIINRVVDVCFMFDVSL